MRRQLVMVHGRSQQQKDSVALKAEWLDALHEGLAKSNLTLPIGEQDVRFPFYGDTLYDLVGGVSADAAAEVIVRGTNTADAEKQFTRAVIEEIRKKAGVTKAQLAEVSGEDVVERGPVNWEWLQSVLKAIDRFVPHGSGTSIALFTRDVYEYLKNPNIRQAIDNGVSAAMVPGMETVVVGHSLGTVVAYNLMRQQGHLHGWKVPLYVSLGSPLAIQEIKRTLGREAAPRCPECVSAWFNAMDERDVVALYPLNAANFPLTPSNPKIENKQNVRNKTSNRHGIAGYLDDQEVAKRIYDALLA